MHTKLGVSHPLAFGLLHCIYGQPLDLVGIYLLCYVHGGAKTIFHDVVQDAFASIMRDVGSHVVCKQTHVLPPPTLYSSHQ
jgi:hypothetical protein